MFTLSCRDLELDNCSYTARASTENKVILLMMEHAMKTHPEKVKELMIVMTREDIADLMRKKIQLETS